MLEVIAIDAADARAAEQGGAGRLEVAADMAADGLTPDPLVVAEIRAATALPIRVMLRARSGFQAGAAELDRLAWAAGELAQAGADGFVFGFLDRADAVDTAATRRLAEAVAPLPWTFHRALDHAADPAGAWTEVRRLPGLDAVLTAGSRHGAEKGLDTLMRRAAGDRGLLLAGGGLRRKHVAVLAAAGVRAFHVGGSVRGERSWQRPVDPVLVREWSTLVASATAE